MEKKAKATAKRTAKPAGSRTAAKRRRRPSHDDISTRAYFIHLDEGHPDELQNWLRAERELTAA